MQNRFIFIFGLGYTGQHLARALRGRRWRVAGTTRTQIQAQKLIDQGFEAMVWTGGSPFPKNVLEGVTHILITIPPDEKGDVVLKSLKVLPASLQWMGYLSATSVYGDHKGALVNEDSCLTPTSPRAMQRVLAENQWLEKRNNHPQIPFYIFRLSGIYGPQRSVLDSIRARNVQRLDKPGHIFSRIHIEDIVETIIAAISSQGAGGIYNLTDDEPASSADVIAYGCELLGVDVPPLIPFEEAAISPRLQEFYSDNKRVSNHKLKESLGIRLLYPTYREGLRQEVYC